MFLFSLFLAQPTAKEERKAAYTGVEGLFKLWKEALCMYQKAVVENRVCYQSFAEDFVHSRLFHDATDADSRNDHLVNLCRIKTLLGYESLVRRYSAQSQSKRDFINCMQELMSGPDRFPAERTPDFQCHFHENTVELITRAANAIPLFKEQVTTEDIRHLFNDCIPAAVPTLRAAVNQHVAYFFSMLDSYGLICRNYQKVIETNRLIGSSKLGSPLSAHGIAHALEQINAADNPVKSKIENWVKQIKLSTIEVKNNG